MKQEKAFDGSITVALNMKMKKRRLLSVLVGLALALGLMLGMSATVYAGATTWYVGDSICLNGSYFYYNDQDSIKFLGSNSLRTVPTPSYELSVEQWRFSSCVPVVGGEEYHIYLTPPDGRGESDIPTGFRIKSGTGTESDPYSFELVYETAPEQRQNHDGITFEPWPYSNNLPGSDGCTSRSYYLTGDVTLTSTWDVPTGTTNLCLNGHGIIMRGDGKVIEFSRDNSSTLNLYDCDTTAEHYIELVKWRGTEIDKAQETTDVNSDGNGVVKITGGYITGGKPGVLLDGYSEEHIFNMNGGTIIGNTNAGGVYLSYGNAKFNMYGGSISNNMSSYSGGGVYMGNRSSFNMDGGYIINNTAGRDGGGVNMTDKSSFNMTGGSITGNTANGTDGTDGGGVWVNDATFKVSGNANISGNKTDGKEKNVYLALPAKINVTGKLDGAAIGVTLGTTDGTGVFAEPGKPSDQAGLYTITANDSARFTSDDPASEVSLETENNKKVLKLVDNTDPIWVGGTPVTPENAEAGIPGETGVATYNATTNTLTLNNYKYETPTDSVGSFPYSNVHSIIEYQPTGADPKPLTIELQGDNYIKAVGANAAGGTILYGINSTGPLKFTGSGTLTAVGNETDETSIGINSSNSIAFNSGAITATGKAKGIYAGGGITIGSANYISAPQNGRLSEDQKTVCNSDGTTVATSIVIEKRATPPSPPPAKTDISGATIVLDMEPLVYTGMPLTPVIKTIGGKTLNPDTDYTVTYAPAETEVSNKKGAAAEDEPAFVPVDAGTYLMTITGKGRYTGTTSTTFTIEKADGTMTAKGNKVTLKSKTKKLKKTKKIAAKKAYTITDPAGQVTFKKVKANKSNKMFKVDSKTGQITVKKGLKRGTYRLTVNVSDPGSGNFNPADTNVVVKIIITK